MNEKELGFTRYDLLVVLICDGYDKLSEDFKDYASKCEFLNTDHLMEKGFLNKDAKGKLVTKDIPELMD